jgi:membrane protease YdiL (CAAX protease family)
MSAHLLFLFLAAAMPVWDIFETRRLKRLRDAPRAKIHSYAKTIAILVLAALWALAASGAGILKPPPALHAALSWLPASAASGLAAGLLAGAAVSLLILPLAAARSPRFRQRIARRLAPLDFFLPTRPAEFRLFPVLCLAAGTCEEILYRAFLLAYLSSGPIPLPAWPALACAALLFGLAHLYQGLSGVLATAVLGLVFSLLFLATGSLVLPMLLHTLIDLRAWLLMRIARPAATPA